MTFPRSAVSPHTVPVLQKAVAVLEAVALGSGESTTKALAATLKISPTTCYRILQTYVAAGWLQPGRNGMFELSYGLVPLLRPLLRHEALIGAVRGPLDELARSTGLSAKLTVRRGDEAVTIHCANSPKGTAITSRVGSVASLAFGSSGAIFLSDCEDEEVARILAAAPAEVWRFQKRNDVWQRVREARRHGVCFDKGSYQPHINTLSTGLQGAGGMLGTITLLGFPQDFSAKVRAGLARELKSTVSGCQQSLMLPFARAAA